MADQRTVIKNAWHITGHHLYLVCVVEWSFM